MKRLIVLAVILSATVYLTACGGQTAGNAGNKPANAANANNAANTTAAKAPVNAASIEADIKAMLADMAVTMVKNDADSAERVYSDNYMFVGPDGKVSTKDERLAAMRSGQSKYDTHTYEEISVRVNAEGNGAVSISLANVKGKLMGKDVIGAYRVTHVWAKTADGWRMASGQATVIAGGVVAKPAEKMPPAKIAPSDLSTTKPAPPAPVNR